MAAEFHIPFVVASLRDRNEDRDANVGPSDMSNLWFAGAIQQATSNNFPQPEGPDLAGRSLRLGALAPVRTPGVCNDFRLPLDNCLEVDLKVNHHASLPNNWQLARVILKEECRPGIRRTADGRLSLVLPGRLG